MGGDPHCAGVKIMEFRDKVSLINSSYVIEDGFLENANFEFSDNSAELDFVCPLFKAHPDYSNLFNRFRRFLVEGFI